jgi:hypothetical protein
MGVKLGLTLREEHRLRVFANRVKRKIFRPKRDEVVGERRRLHNKELYDLYSPPNIIRAKSAVFWGITRRNTPEDRRFHQHHGGSMKSILLG